MLAAPAVALHVLPHLPQHEYPNNMIKQMNTRHRNVLGVSISFLAAVAMISTAQAAKTDSRILAARTQAATTPIEDIAPDIARPVADQFGTGEIKLSGKNVKTLTAGLADAILAKPQDEGANSVANKTDEIGEVAAFITEGVANNPKFLKLGVAKKTTLTILKAALTKAKKDALFFASQIYRDVAGSVALTIANDATLDPIQEKLQKFLLKKAKSIATTKNRTAVEQGLNEGFSSSPDANLRYEDGNIDSLTVIRDSETPDQRPIGLTIP